MREKQKKIVLYNDRIETCDNDYDTKRPDDEHRAFSFYTKVVKTIKNSNNTEPADYDVVAYI